MSPLKAVLFDRDGTLVHDVPYNGDPDRVRPVDGAREAVALLRAHGIRTGVVTNQSGIARGLVTDAEVRHVNRRVDDLLGPFDVWAVCPHGPDDGCHCRKPRPGLVLWAAGRICAHPADCVVIGDIGADVEAAERAGARGILVPNERTRPAETSAAGHVAPDLPTAVRALLDGPPRGRVLAGERFLTAAGAPTPDTPDTPGSAGARASADTRTTAAPPPHPDTPDGPHPRPPADTRTAPDTPGGPRTRPTADTPKPPDAPKPPDTPKPSDAPTPPSTPADTPTHPPTAHHTPPPATPPEAPMKALVTRLDSFGDVLLAGPAVRAVAARAGHVTLLCGPRGAPAARLLPGVDEVLVWDAPWGGFEPPAVRREDIDALVDRIDADTALILTSFHQSPLPTALVLRLAGVGRIAADSEDYPGSLLDVRHRRAPDAHEAEAALDLAEAAGFPRPDDGRLRVHPPPRTDALTGPGPYVVLHPGASVPARAWSPGRAAEAVRELAAAGHRVLVTGDPGERDLTAYVAGRYGTDLGGRTGAPELAGVLAGAGAVVTGNTAPAHLAAAVGTPVVSLFAPVVPAGRWRPYGVPYVLLGDQDAPCAGSRARQCPVPGHPCLNTVTGPDVAAAVEKLLGEA